MGAGLHDIQTKDDIQKLVDSFYEKVNRDELLSPIFNEIAKVNWAEHLPIMYDFWNTNITGEKGLYWAALSKTCGFADNKRAFRSMADPF